MVTERRVDRDEPVIDEITDVRKQVHVLYAFGHTVRVDNPMFTAAKRIAERYDTNISWVVRLAMRQFIRSWEAQSHVRVYFPESSAQDTDGDSQPGAGS